MSSDFSKLSTPKNIDLSSLPMSTTDIYNPIKPNPVPIFRNNVVEELKELNQQLSTKLDAANQTIADLNDKVSELTPKPKKWYVKFGFAIYTFVIFIITITLSEYIRDIWSIILEWVGLLPSK